MFGLIVFGLLGIYLLLLAWATRRGWRWGIEKKGWTGKKRYLGAAIGFLIVYLPVFWDWLPTVAVHQYYCAKDSGFWVYKTLDQWKKENPGVMEGLVVLPSVQATPYGDLQIMNDRFAIETYRHKPIPFLPTSIAERLLVDRKTGEVLSKGVDVGSEVGNLAVGADSLRTYKFWLNQRPCIARDFSKLTVEIENSRRTK
jgi:hypothetical protein